MENADYVAMLQGMPGFSGAQEQATEINEEGKGETEQAEGVHDHEPDGKLTGTQAKFMEKRDSLRGSFSRLASKFLGWRQQNDAEQYPTDPSSTVTPPQEASNADADGQGQSPCDAPVADWNATLVLDQATRKKKIFPFQLWGSGRSFISAAPPWPSQEFTPPQDQALFDPPQAKPLPEEGHVLALTIHQAQPLRPELRLTSPVVRLHCVDRTTGHYLKKTDAARPAVVHNEACDYVMPMQTKPFDLKQRGREGVLCASWEECLLLNEEAVRFFGSDVLLLLEILQLPTSLSNQKRGRSENNVPSWKLQDGHYRVAWAYLSPLSAHTLAQPHRGRVALQLYKYAPPPRFQDRQMPEVFATWQHLCDPKMSAKARRKRARRLLYPAALTVTLAVVHRPEENTVIAAPQVGIRALLATQIESGRLPAEELLHEWHEKSQGAEPADSAGALATETECALTLHARAHHEACIVPCMPQHRISTGSKGCVRVRFSPSGRFLAVVASEALLFPLQVFSAHSGALLASFQGHQSLVYDLSWSSDDSKLLTASSDFTAKLWDFAPGLSTRRFRQPGQATGGLSPGTGHLGASFWHPGEATGGPATVLQHPCYVYAAAFHPTAEAPRLIATAAFDGHVRIWNRDSGEMLQHVPLHKTHINALVFDNVGKRLFTGDGSGHVTECACDFAPGKISLKPLRTSTELSGEPVTCLRLHPNGRRLFVLARRNRLVGIDSRAFAVDRRYKGLKCQEHPIAFDVSPDGRYLVSGSEDGRPYLWQVESAAVFNPFPPLFSKSEAVYDCAWNPVEHTLAVAAVGSGSRAAIFCPEPALVQPFDPSQVAFSVPLNESRTFSLPTEAPLPAELRQMTRSGRSALPDSFTPDKIKEVMSTLRAADTRRLTMRPKDQEVTWQAGLELREHLEVSQSETEGREPLKRMQSRGGAETSSDEGRQIRASKREGSNIVKNEGNEVGNEIGRKDRRERSKATQDKLREARTESEVEVRSNATLGSISLDQSQKVRDRDRRRSNSEASSAGKSKNKQDAVSCANTNPDVKLESEQNREDRLLKRRKERNKWMEFRPESSELESARGVDKQQDPKEEATTRPDEDNFEKQKERYETVREGESTKVEMLERRRSKDRRLSRSKSNKERTEAKRTGSQQAVLRRISTRLKQKLNLSLSNINSSPGREKENEVQDGSAVADGSKGLKASKKYERAKSLQIRKVEEEGGERRRKSEEVKLRRSFTGRLAKVLDPRERIKVRLERQRSRGSRPLAAET